MTFQTSGSAAPCAESTPPRGILNIGLIFIFIFQQASSLYTGLIKMLYLVGLGLSDETDITVKGLEVAKSASRVYLEAYTSILLVDQSVLVRGGNHRWKLQLIIIRNRTMDGQ